jgi:hypothetical protein
MPTKNEDCHVRRERHDHGADDKEYIRQLQSCFPPMPVTEESSTSGPHRGSQNRRADYQPLYPMQPVRQPRNSNSDLST